MGDDIRPPLVASRRMRVGINYMWGYDKYGLYFGPHWRHGEAPRELWMDGWLTDFAATIQKWKSELQVDVVRIFVLCNLQNLGAVDSGGKWAFPPSLDQLFERHFERMLLACAAAEVQLIPSLVDFGIGSPSVRHEQRCAIVTNRSVRDRFYAQTLVPFLQISQKHKDTIFAWEVMNEPGWLDSLGWPENLGLFEMVKNLLPTVSHRALWEFLKQGVDLIDEHGFPSTVGHRFFKDLSRFPTGSIPQFHYYPRRWNADPSRIPPFRSEPSPDGVPHAFLGEFAAGTQGNPWPELNGKDQPGPRERVRERLLGLERRGYRLGMLWPDLGSPAAPGNDPKISVAAAEGIKDYWKPA